MTTGSPDYTETVKIVGTDPSGNLVAVAVDANGYITSVLKGQHGSLLKTLATDEDGRLIAVITDPENIWGVRPAIGNAELATRLGAVPSFEGRGTRVFADTFDYGLIRWDVIKYGAGADCLLTSEDARTGGYSVKLISGTDSYHYTLIATRTTMMNLNSLIGIEFSFRTITGRAEYVHLGVDIDDGNDTYSGVIRFNVSTEELELDDHGTWRTIFSTAYLGSTDRSWSTIKLVLDPVGHKYQRIYANSQEKDISAYTLTPQGYFTSPGVLVSIEEEGEPGYNCEILVDDVIITINEPEA